MEDGKHSHRRKHSHSQRQATRRAGSTVASDKLPSGSAPGITPVFGDLIETDSELNEFAERVLGPYGQYQCAVKKMDTSEQMYGIAEPSAASAKSREVSSKTNQLALSADHKRDRDKKKKQRTTRHENPQGSGIVKAKVSVRPYKSSQLTTSVDASSSEIHVPHVETDSKPKLPDMPAPPQQAPASSTTSTKTKKRQKKPKRSSSHMEEPISELVAHSVPLKPRPEALSIETNSTPIPSDGPDTGDVRHMLNELLHPPPVSLVTPILTPNKLKPFTFPTTHHVFKAPNSTDAYLSRNTSSSSAQQQASTHTQHSQRTHKNVLSAVSGSVENVSRPSSAMRHRHSSSSASSSFSSSSDSEGSSTDAGSTPTSREHSPFTQLSEEESVILPQPVEDKDEGTRLTLEKLKQQITPSNMAAITPLKKTPPHFTEELANLSPAKPLKDPSLLRHDFTVAGLTSQSSIGFHPLYPQHPYGDGGHTVSTHDSGSSTSSSSSGSSEESGEEDVPQPHTVTTSTVAQHSSSQPLASMPRQHFAPALLQRDLTQPAHKKKKKDKSQSFGVTKKHKKTSSNEVRKSLVVTSTTPLVVTPQVPASLLVSIPLTDVKIGKPKVVATVGPYNVRSTSSHPRRNTLDGGLAEGDDPQSRDRYSRLGLQGDDYGPIHDYHRSERPRGHSGAARWERETPSWDHRAYGVPSRSGGRGEYGGRGHGHGWERDSHYRGSNEDYFSDGSHYDNARMEPQRGLGRTHARKMDPEYFMQEARRRKKRSRQNHGKVPGLEKARLYMESVTYFMRHGGAIEYEQQAAAGHNQTVKRNPYKMYSDTLNMIKYCQHMAGECKPLLVLCLRCQSALYWRMYLIKQPSVAPLQKELQEFFLPPKASQSKSPFPGGLSPLPSPASVGSTASTSSAGNASCSTVGDSTTVTMPRHIFNKAAEHMTVSVLINTCLELWRLSESYMEQCKEFFLNADRKANLTVHYYSPVFQVASWVEDILKCF